MPFTGLSERHYASAGLFCGRNTEQALNESVISRARTGYLALYRCDAQANLALVLAVRHQREGDCH